jgi:L-threonylcarbamoyladenylate synthase
MAPNTTASVRTAARLLTGVCQRYDDEEGWGDVMVEYRVEAGRPERHALSGAAAILRDGGVVAYPTDTLYGLAANPFSGAAMAQLYRIKGRPVDLAIPLIAAGLDQIESAGGVLSTVSRRLAERFWPGPLTIVVPKSAQVPDEVTSGGDSVAVRVPDHPLARALIREAGAPLATTSANLSGGPSPVTAHEVSAQLAGRVALILDGGRCPGGVASTVVDLTGSSPVILRPGPISLEEILEAVL